MTATQNIPDLSNPTANKWHPLCYEVSVALDATFPLYVEPCYPAGSPYRGLICRAKGNEDVWRVNFPATVQGDAVRNGSATISFSQWLDSEEGVLFHRVCFRLQPLSRMTNQTRRVAFGRADEKTPFGFDPGRRGGNFINLFLYGLGQTEFKPVFIKVESDQRGVFEYYKVTAEPGEDAVVVKIAKVAENEVPSHLKAALR
jgi:hypothetical protein